MRYWSKGDKEITTVGQPAKYDVTVVDVARWDAKQDPLFYDKQATLGSENLLTSGVIALEFQNMRKYVQEESGKAVLIDILIDAVTKEYGYKTATFDQVKNAFDNGKTILLHILDTDEYAHLQLATKDCFKFVTSGQDASTAFQVFYLYSSGVISSHFIGIPILYEWALQRTKPSYTYSEVGADRVGTASSLVKEHNTYERAHLDLRKLIDHLDARIRAVANSDDASLDQLSELVAYIKNNRSLIEQVTTNKVNVKDIIDNLVTPSNIVPLSAKQGVILNERISKEVQALKTLISELNAGDLNLSGYVETIKDAWKVYTTDGAGETKGVTFANTAVGNSIPQRDANGNICVGSPTDSAHAVPKAYVDGTFIANPKPSSNAVLALKGNEIKTIGYTNQSPYAYQLCVLAPETMGDTIEGTGYQLTNTPTRAYHAANKKYVDETVPKKLSELKNDLPSEIFIATYGKTTYEEVAEAYYSGKQLYLNINKDDKNLELTNKAAKCIASLLRVDGIDRDKSAFTFVCDESGISHKYSINHSTKEWYNSHSKWAITIDSLCNGMSRAQSDISKLLPLLASSLNSFRGEYKKTAGTLEVNAPGIYLVLQGGSGNKTLTILQGGKEVYKSPACNGWIVLSSDTGVVTPIGIKSGIAALAGSSFETPGTYAGWIPGQTTDFTRITYPANCVIWYLGSSNNDIRTWS